MKNIILVFFTIVLLISCKKTTGPAGPQGPQGPTSPNGNGSGKIIGTVRQYSAFNVGAESATSQYTSSLNHVTVSIDGTTISTVTDTLGNYTLNNVPEGVYDLLYVKQNAGLSKKQQVVFPGAGTLYVSPDSVFDKPTTVFTAGYLKDTVNVTITSHFVKLNFRCIPQNKLQVLMVIFGKDNSVSLDNCLSYEVTYFSTFGTFNGFYSSFTYPQLFPSIYPSGTVFYARVYSLSTFKPSYYDYEKNKAVYTNYGTPLAGTFSVTIP